MCTTCGCDHPDNNVKYTIPGEEHNHAHEHGHSHEHEHHHPDNEGDNHNHVHPHTHSHDHSHPHDHDHDHSHDHYHEHEHTHHHSHPHLHSHSRVVQLEQDVLSQNNLLAERNRGWFEAKNIVALNLVSSPGSGKTTLLEKTITECKNDILFFVIEGDQQTLNDAERIKSAGAPVIQINTGKGCHLDAEMVNKAAKQLEVSENSILLIENVGNLVCPSVFDLGEAYRVVVISVTEGDDKPAKYPDMFHSSDICIINKTDLLPYVDFDIEKAKQYARQLNPNIRFFELSAKTGEGTKDWFNWLRYLKNKK
jgi:hydrogenase nickel incorporation protein HypB